MTKPIHPKPEVPVPNTHIRYGYSRKRVPIYMDKATGKTYTANGAMPGRRVKPEIVGSAVALFYRGTPLDEIAEQFEHQYDFRPSKATIYEWVTDYTKLARDRLGSLKARTGNTWVCDESVYIAGGEKFWHYNVLDRDSRFLLASHLARTRTIKQTEIVFQKAKEAAHSNPKRIITDGMTAYPEAIERVFGGDTQHVVSEGLTAKLNNNLSERMQGTFRQRTKTMRGFQDRQSAQDYFDGYRIHYNFFRGHESLKNRRPAEMAGLETSLESWEDVARLDVRPFSYERVKLEKERALKPKPVYPRRVFIQRRRRL
ncbi:MAG: DDE-type integrase/transposase/recombinase [SAR202 cluster bacterium]|nr:DDE-type integrase/transposase/recombinase [SAR202 cluster bacterium]